MTNDKCRVPRHNPAHVFDFIQIVYWLALSTWFGGVLFIAVAAPVIMRAMRDEKPGLPTGLSVNPEGQPGTLLGGSLVGRIMGLLFRVGLVLAGALVLTLDPPGIPS